MASLQFLKTHRTWEDYLGMVLGVVIMLSPWLSGQETTTLIEINAVLVGALVLGLAALELVDLRRWEEFGEALCGIWLAASPFIFGYANAGALRIWHFVLGAIILLVAILELWQDWRATDKDLAQHGRITSDNS